MTTLGFIVQIAAATATPVQAAALLQTRELIEQALGEATKIRLENITLGEAMSVVTEQTGVPIVMSSETMALVPQGAGTRILRVDIANIPLREGLTRIFSPLGMEWFVADDHVVVVAKPSIRKLGCRPSWEQLETLSWLSSLSPGLDEQGLAELRSRVQFHVGPPGAWASLSAAIRNVGAGPGDEVLTVACKSLGWGWTLAGERVVVAPVEEQVRRRLAHRISLSMFRKPLFDVLTTIGEKVSVPVRVEPGALQHLPAQVQRAVDLDVFEETAEEALEKLAAYTGLGYMITPEGVTFYRPGSSTNPPAEAADSPARDGTFRLSDPYVAKMVVPLPDGTAVEWLIRQSEMPEDLRDMRRRDIQKAFDTLRTSRPKD